ncbi:hypothetical protein ACFQY7_42065 [Actinomadura luteofluorescens]|uniref:hypothetical protein n=1 Tax=Actinomadura luteofluorescens TaxID=46163 RepID=UPI00363DEF74
MAFLLGLAAAWQTTTAVKWIVAVVIAICALAAGGFLTLMAPACGLAGYATVRAGQKIHAFLTEDRENKSVTAAIKAYAKKHKFIAFVVCVAAFVLVRRLLGL